MTDKIVLSAQVKLCTELRVIGDPSRGDPTIRRYLYADLVFLDVQEVSQVSDGHPRASRRELWALALGPAIPFAPTVV
jgi:hypothetical protein